MDNGGMNRYPGPGSPLRYCNRAVASQEQCHGLKQFQNPDLQATRVVIDTDPGIDDVAAILMGIASRELRVEALTTIYR